MRTTRASGAYELFMGFRYLLRRLVREPGFTAVAIITLALGIAANTAIFSVMEAFGRRWARNRPIRTFALHGVRLAWLAVASR